MGKGGQQQDVAGNHNSDIAMPRRQAAKQEVLINGEMYDVANFKHPGGSVIKFLTKGGDASEAFLEFHARSKKAKYLLRSLPHRVATAEEMETRGYNGRKDLSLAYAKLRKELVEEGYFKPSPLHIAYRVVELFVLHWIGLKMFHSGNPFLWLISMVWLGVAQGRCGWLMHEGGHYSLTGNETVDKVLQIVIYGYGNGMSAGWWRSQHNRHHATPQKLHHDVDLETLPLLAFNARIASRAKNPVVKAWLSMQHILFMPLSCLLVALFWTLYLHPRFIIKRILRGKWEQMLEAASILLRYYSIFAIVGADYSWPAAIATYNFCFLFGAAYIFTNFALSHTHLPVTGEDEYVHWVEYAASHTTNLNPTGIVSWWMGYLNFQIEHHLFPTMPQFHQAKVSPRVRAMFEECGLVYDSRPYFATLKTTLSNLYNVGNFTGESQPAPNAEKKHQ